MTAAECLLKWLQPRLPAAPFAWLQQAGDAVSQMNRQRLFLSFGLVPRQLGKADLLLTREELAEADQTRPGWNPRFWTIDQAARTWLLLQYPPTDTVNYIRALDQLFATGEVHELVALYQALPVLPHPEAHGKQVREAVRTNMKTVFTAMAHYNPYPAEAIDDPSWNQLILKCLFIGAALDPVVGIESRSNAPLVAMLCDYAQERWSAKRAVCPELWRPIGPYADDRAMQHLERVLTTGTPLERAAAVLTLRTTPHPRAAKLLENSPDANHSLTWADIAAQAYLVS